MKSNKITLMLLLSIIAVLLAACQHSYPGIAPTTTPPTTATSAPATTAPPATTTPIDAHTELSPEDIVEFLYEADKLFDAGETIVLKYHLYLHLFVNDWGMVRLGIADVVKDETITVYCGTDNAKEAGIKKQVQFLYAAAKLIETHPDCYYTERMDCRWDCNHNHSLVFYCQYKKVGCETIEEWLAVPPEEKDAANFFFYDGYADFRLNVSDGYIVCTVRSKIDSTHWFDDCIYIFRFKDGLTYKTLYEEYIMTKGEG